MAVNTVAFYKGRRHRIIAAKIMIGIVMTIHTFLWIDAKVNRFIFVGIVTSAAVQIAHHKAFAGSKQSILVAMYINICSP